MRKGMKDMASGSMNISISDYKKLCDDLRAINTDTEKAISRTVSDFKSRAPGWVSSAVTEEYTIKKQEVKSSLKGAKKVGTIKVAGQMVDNIQLDYRGRSLTPTHFKMSPRKPSDKRDKKTRLIPGGNIEGFAGEVAAVRPIRGPKIKVEIHKGKKETLNGKYGPKPFLATNGHGTFLPFQRMGDMRESIVSIKTTSVPQMITNEKVSEDIQKRIEEEMGKRLEHHIQQALSK